MSDHSPALIQYAVDRVQLILNTKILEEPYYPETSEKSLYMRVLQEAAFVELIIRLYDLLDEVRGQKKRISFQTDVKLFPHTTKRKDDGVRDITEAILRVRDIICHLPHDQQFITPDAAPKTRNHKLKAQEFYAQVRFNVIWNKQTLRLTDKIILECEYDDDAAFFYGPHRLYLNRHIIRAFQDVKQQLGLRSTHE